jgi:hypothetical protein
LKKLVNRFQRLFKPAPAADVKKLDLDQYFVFECWNQYAELPDSVVPYVDLIKSKEEWNALGFEFKQNKIGGVKKLKIDNRYFSFIAVNPNNPMEAEAIRTGKRITKNRNHIQQLLDKGCLPDEFMF